MKTFQEYMIESWGEKHQSFSKFKDNAQAFADHNTWGDVEYKTNPVTSGGKTWHQTIATVGGVKTGIFNHTAGPGSEEGFGQHLSRYSKLESEE